MLAVLAAAAQAPPLGTEMCRDFVMAGSERLVACMARSNVENCCAPFLGASDAALGMEAKPQKKNQRTAQFTVLKNGASACLVIRKTSF